MPRAATGNGLHLEITLYLMNILYAAMGLAPCFWESLKIFVSMKRHLRGDKVHESL
jgi:hypothetical protein